MLHGKIISYMLSFSFVVLSSTKLSHTFIIFISLCRSFIFCDHLGLIFCFSNCLFTYCLENSFLPICARKKYILFSTFVIVCDLIEECFYFSDVIEQATVFGKRCLAPFSNVALAGQRCVFFPVLLDYLHHYLLHLYFPSINKGNARVT